MLGLLVLLLVAATVSLLGQALVPHGMPGGLGWAVLAGMAGAAQAAAIALLLLHLAALGLMKISPRKPTAEPLVTALEAVVKRAP